MSGNVSINSNSGVPYKEYGNANQKKAAANFVKANDKTLTEMAYFNSGMNKKNAKFSRNVARAVLSLPLLGAAAAAIATKGKLSAKTLSAAKGFVGTAVGIATPLAVVAANDAVAAKKPKLARAERKHPILTFGGLIAAATGALAGVEALGKKISPKAGELLSKLGKNAKVSKLVGKFDAAPEAVKNAAKKVAGKIHLPNAVKEKLSTVASKIKIPQVLKDGAKKVTNSPFGKSVAKGLKNTGKTLLKYPVTAALGAIIVATIVHSANEAKTVNKEKELLKNAQLNTAKDLINAYAMENDSLKASNSKAAFLLEKGKQVVAEDNE